MKNPPAKQTAAANIAFRGPAFSSHLPKTAADSPRNTIAMLKITAICVWLQSLAADLVMPRACVNGILNTLNE